MAVIERLGAEELRAVVQIYRDALRAHQEALNRLNVYPVPDGDTGTNMALTLASVCDDVGAAEPDLTSTCKAISHGSLMGARGNSGVILSQILRGISSVTEDAGGLDGPATARALAAASEAAYGAVMRPVEGTILTVVRECSEAAVAVNDGGDSALLAVLEAAKARGEDALSRTPEMLPVLAEAGVVDAGGCGFLLLIDSLLHVVDGRPVREPQVGEGEIRAGASVVHAHAGGSGDGVGDLRYEVMYFLEAPDEAIPAFKDVWAGIGDSIVVVGGDGIWNCHIHTDDVGASIEAAIDIGRPRQIRVTDLMDEVEEERWVREAGESGDDTPEHLQAEVPTAVVAVATGDGIRRIFHSLGVRGIVTGGQSMNPSTADLLAAVEAVPASEVVVLPNNKNIIAVAEQVDSHTDKRVEVVPTKSITEGFAALVAYDPESAASDNAKAMADAATAVVAGEVTRAVRNSTSDAGPITEGDWMGISRAGIRSVSPDLAEAAIALLDELVADEHEIVTIIEGEGSTPACTRRLTEWLADEHPGVTPEVHHGGQPLYPYLLGIE